MIKVLHVGEYVQGGVATYIKTLIQHPEYEDVVDYVICSDLNSEHTWNIPEDRVTYYEYKRNLLNIGVAIKAVWQEIKRIQPDVIYCHSSWAGVFVRLPLLFRKKKYCVLYNAHGWAFLRDCNLLGKWIYAIVERMLSTVTDCIINVSKYEMNSGLKAGIVPEKMKLIYSGISPQKEETLGDVCFDYSKINLLFVGRFDPQKGIDVLLEAMEKVKRKDIHLTLIGDNVVGGLNVEKKNTKNITFLGWIPHEEISKYYEACDAVIMPSRWEAFGLVAIEAMKYGKPVIASDCGALPELVIAGENGYVFTANLTMSLVKCIEALNKDVLRNMCKQIEAIFLKRFLADNMIFETVECYKRKITDNCNIKVN